MIKRNLFFLFSIVVVSLASVILCVFNYDPNTAKDYQFAYFYASFFFLLVGIGSLVIFYSKISLSKKETVYSYFWPSVRQAAFLSLAITALLVLRGLKLLDLWVGAPLTLIILLLELFFQTKKANHEKR